jgi:hypothetical protein
MDRRIRLMGSAGVILLGVTGYLAALEHHYKSHPDARGDGWIPLEWRSYHYLAREYQDTLNKKE